MRPILVLVGPTAVGKTGLAIELATQLNGEIISADSMQVYKGLDIGTAKPTVDERRGVPHHMLDVVEPSDEFSVAEYQAMVENILTELAVKDKVPILTGGTGLYIRAVLQGFLLGAEGKDASLRAELYNTAEKQGNEVLHARLEEVDAPSAKRLHPNDLRRVVRALEVYETTGTPLSGHLAMQKERPPVHRGIKFGLMREREHLYQRIDARVDEMLVKGLVEEVQRLLRRGLAHDSTAMQALGYKELVGYLEGHYSLEEAVYLLKRDTRRYAKRQLTWFRRDKAIKWISLDDHTSQEAVTRIVEDYRLQAQLD